MARHAYTLPNTDRQDSARKNEATAHPTKPSEFRTLTKHVGRTTLKETVTQISNERAEAVSIAGLKVIASTPKQAVRSVLEATEKTNGASFHFINAYTVSLTSKDKSYQALLNQAAAVFPDGKPLAWFGSRKNNNMQQVRGPATFEAVIDQGQNRGTRHYLLGSSNETLKKLKANLELKYPNALIVGTHSPPFRSLTREEIINQDAEIQASGADIVWVGLGTPKQDFEAYRIAASTNTVAASVGAAFDFSAGTKPLAPEWVGAIGMEWFFRLLTEPKRLWKRYLIGNTVFLKTVIVNWTNE